MAARLCVITLALLVLAAGRAESSATFVIHDNDTTGVGFKDTTHVAPVGGNPGTTVGQQRLNAFQFAADLWGARLTSSIKINVDATFAPLACTDTTATLGSAGPLSANTFGGPGVPPYVPPNTWVVVAEAEKLVASNLNGTASEITAKFNGKIGSPGCVPTLHWYYGYDSNPPSGYLDFVTVLLHELGHGLGFLTLVDGATGAEFGGLDDVFENNLRDDVNSPSTWTTMSNAQRLASAVHTNHLVWAGPNATSDATLTSGQDTLGRKLMYTPNPVQLGSNVSHWTQSTAGGANCATCVDQQPLDLMKPAYTVPLHRTFVSHLALEDIGWGTVTSPNSVTVTTLSDEDNGFLGGGSGVSLREAVNRSYPGDVIDFAVTGTITLSGGPLVIAHNLSVHGPALNTVTVSGNSATRVFQVNAGIKAEILNLDIANGKVFGFGTQGANIRNEGALHVGYCTVRNGFAQSDGGAFFNIGTLDVDHTLVRDNHADFDGAGLRNDAGVSTFVNCTFTGGTTGFSGAGLRNVGGSACVVRNCTVSGNQASLNGGGMEGSFQLQNSIVAGNTAASSGPDINGSISSLGYNLIGNTSGASGFVGTDALNKNPMLGALANRGGPTLVMPISGGPAFNQIPTGSCVVADDQRGVVRPIADACDIGAFEQDDVVAVPPTGALAFGIQSAGPNPAMHGRLIVRFALSSAAPARLTVLDVSGRRVMSREVGSLGAGQHEGDLMAGGKLRPGLYFVRLEQARDVQTIRVTVLN
jgi:hypothetical protein